MPPQLDESLVSQLAILAARLDGASPGEYDDDLAEFNRLAGTDLPIGQFQSIYGGEEHTDWVRRLLNRPLIKPAINVTREELAEVVRRAMPQYGDLQDYQAYMAIFDTNVPLAQASNLIFYPLDYNPRTNTWGGGRQMGEYDPTPEEIVEWALTGTR